MSAILASLGFLGAVLFAVAIISRLGSDKQVPGTITAGFNAMTNLFKGAFS